MFNNQSDYFSKEEFLEIRKEIDVLFKETGLGDYFTFTKSTYGNSSYNDFIFTLKVKPIRGVKVITADPIDKIELFKKLFNSIKDYIVYNKRNFVFLSFREYREGTFTFEFQPKQLKLKSDLRR